MSLRSWLLCFWGSSNFRSSIQGAADQIESTAHVSVLALHDALRSRLRHSSSSSLPSSFLWNRRFSRLQRSCDLVLLLSTCLSSSPLNCFWLSTKSHSTGFQSYLVGRSESCRSSPWILLPLHSCSPLGWAALYSRTCPWSSPPYTIELGNTCTYTSHPASSHLPPQNQPSSVHT